MLQPCCRIILLLDRDIDRDDRSGLPLRHIEGLRSIRERWNQHKVFGLIHKGLWISAPYGQGEGLVLPPALAICPIVEHAWVFKNIETALDKVDILKVGFGIYSEPKAIN